MTTFYLDLFLVFFFLFFFGILPDLRNISALFWIPTQPSPSNFSLLCVAGANIVRSSNNKHNKEERRRKEVGPCLFLSPLY